MKPAVADWRYKVYCVRIQAISGAVIRFTAHPRDLVMGNGAVYSAGGGYDFTGQSVTTAMSPGVMDLSGIADALGISKAAIASGVFDSARLYCFATTWGTPVEDEEPIGLAILGRTRLQDDRYVIEMMSIVDLLSQSVGLAYQPSCPKTFGGQEYGGCHVDLAPLTVTGTITAVTSGTVLRDSARTEAADFFGAGSIRFTSGDNAGLAGHEIKSYAADGTITLFEPFYYPVAVGDAYEMVAGCRKRKEDCQAHGNITRFGGDSYIPTSSIYSKSGK